MLGVDLVWRGKSDWKKKKVYCPETISPMDWSTVRVSQSEFEPSKINQRKSPKWEI